jgi:hypothetical protein
MNPRGPQRTAEESIAGIRLLLLFASRDSQLHKRAIASIAGIRLLLLFAFAARLG